MCFWPKEGKRVITIEITLDKTFLNNEKINDKGIDFDLFKRAVESKFALTENTNLAIEEAGLPPITIDNGHLDKWISGFGDFESIVIEEEVSPGIPVYNTADQIILKKYAERSHALNVGIHGRRGLGRSI